MKPARIFSLFAHGVSIDSEAVSALFVCVDLVDDSTRRPRLSQCFSSTFALCTSIDLCFLCVHPMDDLVDAMVRLSLMMMAPFAAQFSPALTIRNSKDRAVDWTRTHWTCWTYCMSNVNGHSIEGYRDAPIESSSIQLGASKSESWEREGAWIHPPFSDAPLSVRKGLRDASAVDERYLEARHQPASSQATTSRTSTY